MPKILNKPKFKPITCEACKCRYEYEEGDSVSTTVGYHDIYRNSSFVISMTLQCPVCGYTNDLHIIEE